MRAARRALLTGGPEAVRVEPLALALGVTKGSFYWHFSDRRELLDALLVEWEEERSIALADLPLVGGRVAVRALMHFLKPRVAASERGEIPSDAAIFAWAATDPAIARRVNAAEAERVAFMQELVGDADLGEFLYLAYLGFAMRRRRVPSAASFFPTLALLAENVAGDARRPRLKTAKNAAASRGAPKNLGAAIAVQRKR